jgi:hypothetical protein
MYQFETLNLTNHKTETLTEIEMKINKSELMKKAWEIARTAVETFGGKVREYFSESLKMAWGEAKNSILDIVKNHASIDSFSEWKKHGHDRIYFNLKGYDNSRRGCRNTKIYYDNNTGRLIISEGRGSASSDFCYHRRNFICDVKEHSEVRYF